MNTRSLKPVLPFLFLTVIACSRSESQPGADKSVPGGTVAQDSAQKAEPGVPETQLADNGAIAQAREKAGELDRRTPVPMLPQMSQHQKQNMRAHLEAVQRIIGALAREDWDEVTSASKEIGSSDKMRRMCGRMGAGAPVMAQMGLAFHQQADGITEAAARKDTAGTLAALSSTVQVCNGCHAAFRQDVVDFDTYEKRVAAVSEQGEAPVGPAARGCACGSGSGVGTDGGQACQGGCRGGCSGSCRSKAKPVAP